MDKFSSDYKPFEGIRRAGKRRKQKEEKLKLLWQNKEEAVEKVAELLQQEELKRRREKKKGFSRRAISPVGGRIFEQLRDKRQVTGKRYGICWGRNKQTENLQDCQEKRLA